MDCPACGHVLVPMNAGGVIVDICKGGCGGIWFDNSELECFDEPSEHAGEALLYIERDPNVKINHTEKRKCPQCGDIYMRQHFFSVKRKVVVDECSNCGGVWLDCGELGLIRGLFPSEKARKEAADVYFKDIFQGVIDGKEQEEKEALDKDRKIARIFRFICPSYYAAGEQKWGAF